MGDYCSAVLIRLYVKFSESLTQFSADASGVTAIEYGLIAAGIAVAIITAVGLVGDGLSAAFTNVASELASG